MVVKSVSVPSLATGLHEELKELYPQADFKNPKKSLLSLVFLSIYKVAEEPIKEYILKTTQDRLCSMQKIIKEIRQKELTIDEVEHFLTNLTAFFQTYNWLEDKDRPMKNVPINAPVVEPSFNVPVDDEQDHIVAVDKLLTIFNLNPNCSEAHPEVSQILAYLRERAGFGDAAIQSLLSNVKATAKARTRA